MSGEFSRVPPTACKTLEKAEYAPHKRPSKTSTLNTAAMETKRVESIPCKTSNWISHTPASHLTAFWKLALVAQMSLGVAAWAQWTQVNGSHQPPLMDRQKEIALALSACPAFVAGKAAVYALSESGYVKVRDSQNGFTAIVDHALPTSQEPQCMDAEGTRTTLPRMLIVAEMRAQGKSREEIERNVADAFAKGVFQPPARPGVDYMLSTQNGVPDENGVVAKPFPPHVMFYAPYLTNVEIGSDGKPGASPAFIVGEGTPHALIIVPVASHMASSHDTVLPLPTPSGTNLATPNSPHDEESK
jgi:hypothetical protein